jgi:hypothetical protein
MSNRDGWVGRWWGHRGWSNRYGYWGSGWGDGGDTVVGSIGMGTGGIGGPESSVSQSVLLRIEIPSPIASSAADS